MADLTVTAASVDRVSGQIDAAHVAGEAIAAGKSVYLATATKKWMLAKAAGTAEQAGYSTIFGIALDTGVSGQPMAVQLNGVINPGATVAVGKIYLISETFGGIAPSADITTTADYITILGIGSTAAHIDMSIKSYTGVQAP